MKITKNIIAKLDGAYAVCSIELFGKLHFLAATEKKGKCFLFSPPNWEVSTVWDKPGGTMGIASLATSKAAFLAIQNFFPIFKAEEASIVYVELKKDMNFQWNIKELAVLPFAHRIGVIYIENNPYLVASTLYGGEKDSYDKFKPGSVYIGRIPERIDGLLYLEPILQNISSNHGFHLTTMNNQKVILVSGCEGVFLISIPEKSGKSWEYKCLIDNEISDIFAFDIDNDGIKEIVTIEPFHGDNLLIYKSFNSKFEPVYETNINYGHAMWCGKLNNLPFILLGNRGGKKELLFMKVIKCDPFIIEEIILDQGGGPSQFSVIQKESYITILAANNNTGEVVLYNLKE